MPFERGHPLGYPQVYGKHPEYFRAFYINQNLLKAIFLTFHSISGPTLFGGSLHKCLPSLSHTNRYGIPCPKVHTEKHPHLL